MCGLDYGGMDSNISAPIETFQNYIIHIIMKDDELRDNGKIIRPKNVAILLPLFDIIFSNVLKQIG